MRPRTGSQPAPAPQPQAPQTQPEADSIWDELAILLVILIGVVSVASHRLSIRLSASR